MMDIYCGAIDQTPLGTFWIAANDQGLIATKIGGTARAFEAALIKRSGHSPQYRPEHPIIQLASEEVKAYFTHQLTQFEAPIDWSQINGFQEQALRLIHTIPFGDWKSYGEVATLLGNPKAARAVGRANATNPITLIIPCHRILGASGKLHGYSGTGGIETKAWLLRHEGSRKQDNLGKT